MRDEGVFHGRVFRWGSSYGVRVDEQVADRMGLKPGMDVTLRVLSIGKEKEALSRFPLFSDPDPDASLKHDEYIGQARQARYPK